jgi:hypothetical protein
LRGGGVVVIAARRDFLRVPGTGFLRAHGAS